MAEGMMGNPMGAQQPPMEQQYEYTNGRNRRCCS